MAEVLFFLTAIGTITGAVGVIALRNPFYSVLALVAHLISLAMLFLLLRAEFVAAAQVIVYAGAVMVLYVFVVSYVGGTEEPIGVSASRGFKVASVAFGGALFLVLAIAVLGSGLQAIDSQGAPYVAGFGSPAEIGKLLLTDFLLPFEVASFLLLIAAVGAVTLARRRGGLETPGELAAYSALDFVRPAGTGTMAEGVGGRRRLPAAAAAPDRDAEDATA
ncbi:MAG: NADH-quinone oxidoreductase subunit [Solirubrobacterales bacterium]|jgi:NADH:ubiquinone oxidoreductase subunit 6 (subunit J)|nr:NADH-quinone oxidoreductase subunit [Solirubrobacterales bacterium]